MIYLDAVKSGKFVTGPILYANKKNMAKGTAIISVDDDMSVNLERFRKIRDKIGNVIIPQLRGFYFPSKMSIKFGDKKAKMNLLPLLTTLKRERSAYKIKDMFSEYASYGDSNIFYDFSPYLSKVKSTITNGRPTRAMNIDAMNYFRGSVERLTSHKNKVIVMKAPILTKLGVKSETIPTALQHKQFSLPLLILLWAQESPGEFRGWMKQHGVTFAFHNDNQTVVFKHTDIVESGGESIYSGYANYAYSDEIVVQEFSVDTSTVDTEYIEKPEDVCVQYECVNFDDIEYLESGAEAGYSDGIDSHMMIRRLRRLDSATVDGELIHDDEYSVDDMEDIANEITDDDVLLAVITGSDVSGEEEDVESTEEASVAIIDAIEESEKVKLDDIIDIMNDNTISESDRSVAIMEKVSYQDSLKDLETPEIKAYRAKMNKKFGPQTLEEAAIIAAQNKLVPSQYPVEAIGGGFEESTLYMREEKYAEQLDESDLMNIITHFSKASKPLFITDIKRVDASDRMNKQEKITIKALDDRGDEVEFSFFRPKVHNDGVFLGGSTKSILKQDAAKVIGKFGSDVIVTTAYKKFFVNAKGKYPSRLAVQLLRLIKKLSKLENPIVYSLNDHSIEAMIMTNRLSYDALNIFRYMYSIENSELDTKILFNKDNKDSKDDKKGTYFGTWRGKDCYHDPEKNTVTVEYTNEVFKTIDFIEAVVMDSDPRAEEVYKSLPKTIPKDIDHAQCVIMGQNVPVVYLLLINIGLKGTLDMLKEFSNLEYSVVKGTKKLKLPLHKGYGSIDFDGFTIAIKFNNRVNELILSPLCNMDLTRYQSVDISKIMSDVMGNTNFALYIENFIDGFFDPTSIRYLKSHNLPYTFSEVLVYCVQLLFSYKTYTNTDARNYRLLTTGEIINRITYNAIASAHEEYAVKRKRGSKSQFVMKPDAVNKEIVTLLTTSEAPLSSPIAEVAMNYSKSFKGTSGVNNERSYNKDRRMFEDSHLGNTSMSTAASANAGVVKSMPLNPAVINLNGDYLYIPPENVKNVSASRVISLTEGLVPYSTYYDSAHRVLMIEGQYKHLLPVTNAEPNYISYGVDDIVPYASNAFSIKAQQDGEIIEVNDNFVKIKYKDGTIEPIKLNEVLRNSAKGFFLNNNMVVKSDLKVGKKVKKNTILAYSKYFFREVNGNVVFAGGPMAWCLIYDSAETYEDGGLMFKSMSDKLATPLVRRIDAKFKISTDIKFICTKLNEMVASDEYLLQFNMLTDDGDMSKYLSEFANSDASIKTLKPKYSGKLVDIKCYYRESGKIEMHPSVKKAIAELSVMHDIKGNESNAMDGVTDNFLKETRTSKPVKLTGGLFSKINGSNVENGEILFEFFVETTNVHGIADKLVIDRALKNEISKVLPDSMAPVGVETGRKIDVSLNTYSVFARKTPGLFMTGYTNLILIHLAREFRRKMDIPVEPGSMLDFDSLKRK